MEHKYKFNWWNEDWQAGETEVLGENLPLCPPQIPHD
jgi:hypothetical protein